MGLFLIVLYAAAVTAGVVFLIVLVLRRIGR